ncbi:MAG: pilus assembly protein N-terminal domain-containing protein [Caulobacterales bacterium]|nr:pilus assembly protein N-terminal domain-containing protein [Caulobacterales bacterium]
MRRTAVALLALVALAPAPLALAQSRGLTVEVDHIARLNLNGTAGSVIVGNPQIADVTVVDARTLYVSGRGAGVTEIAVLDDLGRTIYQGQVIVSAPSSGEVRVWRGAAVTHMACGTSCSPSSRGGPSSGTAAGATPGMTPGTAP